MKYLVETEKESEGRWIAEISELPGCLVYGDSPSDASNKAKALALRIIADRIEHGEMVDQNSVMFEAA